MNALATARRHGRLAITLLALAGAACSSAPRRDQIEPVTLPDNLGERRLVGHDTLWVVSGRSWEVASPVQGPLRAAQVALDDAAREYRRYWDDDPPLVRVVIDTLAPRPAASAAAESRDGRAAPPMGAMMGEHLSYALEAGTRVVHLSMPAPAAQPASRERDGRGASRPMMLPVGDKRFGISDSGWRLGILDK